MDESIAVAAPARAVWQAIADPELRSRWWPGMELDPVVGGRFTERWTDEHGREVVTTGVVIEAVEDRLLALIWADEGWQTTTMVEVRLGESGGVTRVGVRHTGWDGLPDPEILAAKHRAGWREHLNDLRRAVEDAV
ncbi:hypothetical protein Pth03_31690 [Planotetraspora thailandica]|uniref:Activator of Hsp90 ATPase homologue 1/2-like C-terminal domain-containing protein n=1 Tax=Planotetraspora thailandica TaxID=487172 RepID=A0A8J3VCF7_9ACTN|nr:hypothetical protein Pth03_31690 [Planotetraspora thailandica]